MLDDVPSPLDSLKVMMPAPPESARMKREKNKK
jgi:hypothetical protein